MIGRILSVGGYTLLSRATGFVRDVILGAVLGAGLANDAFVVAFRLPNHFRTIFGEGAFNAAYVPAYASTLQREGAGSAHLFASRIFTLLLASQIVVLALAFVFTPDLVDLLAPGFRNEPGKFELAVSLTRITFPYLLCITLVTLQTGTLNATGRFAAGAFAPVLLNVTMVATLAIVSLFPSAAYAAAWGVLAGGVAQLALLLVAVRRAGLLEHLTWPRLDGAVRRFFRVLGPAVIGSAGVQIAIFADTIIGSFLPTGGVSSIYYADRLYQLPVGVIGIAAGTVLLPEMSRAFAADNRAAAFHAQNRTLALSILLAIPCFVAFVTIPEFLTRAAFLRGRFTAADAQAAADVLAAYGVGLLPVVFIASARASFQSRGDTTTPMVIALTAVALNVGLKLLLFKPFGAPGLALATAAGAWINLIGLLALAWRGGWFVPDDLLGRIATSAFFGGCGMGGAILLTRDVFPAAVAGLPVLHDVIGAGLVGSIGLLVYAAISGTMLHGFGVPLGRLRWTSRRGEPSTAV